MIPPEIRMLILQFTDVTRYTPLVHYSFFPKVPCEQVLLFFLRTTRYKQDAFLKWGASYCTNSERSLYFLSVLGHVTPEDDMLNLFNSRVNGDRKYESSSKRKNLQNVLRAHYCNRDIEDAKLLQLLETELFYVGEIDKEHASWFCKYIKDWNSIWYNSPLLDETPLTLHFGKSIFKVYCNIMGAFCYESHYRGASNACVLKDVTYEVLHQNAEFVRKGLYSLPLHTRSALIFHSNLSSVAEWSYASLARYHVENYRSRVLVFLFFMICFLYFGVWSNILLVVLVVLVFFIMLMVDASRTMPKVYASYAY